MAFRLCDLVAGVERKAHEAARILFSQVTKKRSYATQPGGSAGSQCCRSFRLLRHLPQVLLALHVLVARMLLRAQKCEECRDPVVVIAGCVQMASPLADFLAHVDDDQGVTGGAEFPKQATGLCEQNFVELPFELAEFNWDNCVEGPEALGQALMVFVLSRVQEPSQWAAFTASSSGPRRRRREKPRSTSHPQKRIPLQAQPRV